MSAFQDFGPLSERRRVEMQQTKRKRMIITGSTISFVVVLAVVCVAAVYYDPTDSTDGPSSSSLSSSSIENTDTEVDDANSFHTSAAIQGICSPTDHRNTCESNLKKYAEESAQPKDLVRAVIRVVVDEVDEAFKRADEIKTDDPAVKAAIEICQEVHGYAVDDLNSSLSIIQANRLDQLPDQVNELKNWLSAVAAYQQTCIDGFPKGELRTKMQDTLKLAKELTSNALAIVGRLKSLLSMLSVASGANHRLLGEAVEALVPFDEDCTPAWVSQTERRMLAIRATDGMTPNVTVAKDGSGAFTTISDALALIPERYEGRYVIYVKEGVYQETVVVSKKMINVTIYGDGSRKTIVSGSMNYADGVTTFRTAPFAAVGEGFIAVAMGFQNTAGSAKNQAVALRVQSDRSIFLNCRMEGYQETLYAHSHRQFYRGCVILGTVDFIFGDAAAVFQNCIITVRRPLENQKGIILAQGRTISHESTGFVIHNCRIIPDDDLALATATFPSYLGRPRKEFSHTAIMETDIERFISPEGYLPWSGDFALRTLAYREYNNKGAGADTSNRVRWPGFKVITKTEAITYAPAEFIQGADWIPRTSTPVRLGLYGS